MLDPLIKILRLFVFNVIYVDNKNAFENAINLVEGDILSGKEFISREEYSNGEVVSISVENAATYISEGILSHNIK